MTVVPRTICQHAEEAAMLWLLRRAAVGGSHYSLADLSKLDCRVEAHLDGLRIAGDEAWNLCEKQLVEHEEGEVFAAGLMALESGRPERVAMVCSLFEEAPETVDGLVSALGWCPLEQVQKHIQALARSDKPIFQRVGIAAAAIHRRHPGEAFAKYSRAEDLALRARALKAAGELGGANLWSHVESALNDQDAECRFAAAWSGALMGMTVALPRLREFAEGGARRAPAAVDLMVRRMSMEEAQTWRKWLAEEPKRLRLAIHAASALGEPTVILWLISLMDQLPLARLAGEAFTTITGADIAYRDLERKPPKDFNAGPTEDPADENVEMDPDDNLPWPEPKLVEKWWQKNQLRFQKGTRYLCGQPITPDWLKTVLRDGYQRRRAAAALELALANPGQPLFNVKAPGFRQIEWLGKPGPPIR